MRMVLYLMRMALRIVVDLMIKQCYNSIEQITYYVLYSLIKD